ncbi:hypothetical protein AALP_AAs51044U000100 [Arabis alpina]|uniref:Uncharacterized protein n=1 Tax=Arabis alpina TaxID=50452 RepID=A0A087G260_ARAAL|nr:hypothetical protein AALP_AAs51044U000100 [Arabis alpina]
MTKKRGGKVPKAAVAGGKVPKAAATGAKSTTKALRRLAEAAAAENSNSGDRANAGSSGSVARSNVGVGTTRLIGGLQNPSGSGSLRRQNGLPRSSMGDGTSVVRPASSDSSTPSARPTLLGSQTFIPTQYPPSTQPPHLIRRKKSCTRLNPQRDEEQATNDNHRNQLELRDGVFDEDSEESDSDGEEEEREEEREEEGQEQVDEQVADPGEQEEYDQLLDNLMSLPGRGHLPLLSPHQIPNKETTW